MMAGVTYAIGKRKMPRSPEACCLALVSEIRDSTPSHIRNPMEYVARDIIERGYGAPPCSILEVLTLLHEGTLRCLHQVVHHGFYRTQLVEIGDALSRAIVD